MAFISKLLSMTSQTLYQLNKELLREYKEFSYTSKTLIIYVSRIWAKCLWASPTKYKLLEVKLFLCICNI